jgi:hypothetical protein
MTLVALNEFQYFPMIVPGAFTGINIASNTAKLAAVLEMPVAGTLSKIWFKTVAVTTPADIVITVETIAPASPAGAPSGTLVATGATGTVTAPTANTVYEVALTTPVALNRKQSLAIVAASPSGTPNQQIGKFNNPPAVATGFNLPYQALATTGAYANAINPPSFGLFVDGTWLHVSGMYPISSGPAVSAITTANTTPNERGTLFTLPIGARIQGVWAQVQAMVASTVQIYDMANVLVAQATPVPPPNVPAVMSCMFAAPVDLPAGFQGRVSVKPTTNTTSTMYYFDMSSAAHMTAIPGGTDWHSSTRKDAGAWTNTPSRRECVGLIISHYDTGSAASSRKYMTAGGLVSV